MGAKVRGTAGNPSQGALRAPRAPRPRISKHSGVTQYCRQDGFHIRAARAMRDGMILLRLVCCHHSRGSHLTDPVAAMLRGQIVDIVVGSVFLFVGAASCSIAVIRRRARVRIFVWLDSGVPCTAPYA
jgi:hypothetical protein